MRIQLAPSIEAKINERIELGTYPDADTVVEEALQLLEARDRKATLRELLQEALDQASRGEVIEMTPDFWPSIMRETKEANRRGDPIADHVKP